MTKDIEGLRAASEALANEAARAVTEPRRFHENEDGRQQSLGRAVSAVRRALDATDRDPRRAALAAEQQAYVGRAAIAWWREANRSGPLEADLYGALARAIDGVPEAGAATRAAAGARPRERCLHGVRETDECPDCGYGWIAAATPEGGPELTPTVFDESHKIYSIEHLLEKLDHISPPLWGFQLYIYFDSFGDHPNSRKYHAGSVFSLSSGGAGVYCEKDSLQEAILTLIAWHERHPEAADPGKFTVNTRVFLGESHKISNEPEWQ